MSRPTALLALYQAVAASAEPLTAPLLRRRARAGREDPVRLGERLGRPGAARPEGPLVWLHGVSVGETQSLLPLVDALRRRRPDHGLLVTSGTLTSATLLAQRLPAGVIHQYAPVDAPGAVGRFLDHWRPDAGLIAESEVWPNLILEAHRRGVRLALVSARITEASARGWARAPRSARAVFSTFETALPQDRASEARLRVLGAAIGPRLNLKLLGEPLPVDEAVLARLQAVVAARRVVVAVSTHPGEETPIVAAVHAADPEALLILVPRHPERGPSLAEGLKAPLRSAGQDLAADQTLYVADTLGELGLFLRLADVAVMGGSFVTGVGGHNPMEAARLGVPTLTGPHAFNAAEAFEGLISAEAAEQVTDAAVLPAAVTAILSDPDRSWRMGQAALAFAQAQTRALDEAMARLEALLPR